MENRDCILKSTIGTGITAFVITNDHPLDASDGFIIPDPVLGQSLRFAPVRTGAIFHQLPGSVVVLWRVLFLCLQHPLSSSFTNPYMLPYGREIKHKPLHGSPLPVWHPSLWNWSIKCNRQNTISFIPTSILPPDTHHLGKIYVSCDSAGNIVSHPWCSSVKIAHSYLRSIHCYWYCLPGPDMGNSFS